MQTSGPLAQQNSQQLSQQKSQPVISCATSQSEKKPPVKLNPAKSSLLIKSESTPKDLLAVQHALEKQKSPVASSDPLLAQNSQRTESIVVQQEKSASDLSDPKRDAKPIRFSKTSELNKLPEKQKTKTRFDLNKGRTNQHLMPDKRPVEKKKSILKQSSYRPSPSPHEGAERVKKSVSIRFDDGKVASSKRGDEHSSSDGERLTDSDYDDREQQKIEFGDQYTARDDVSGQPSTSRRHSPPQRNLSPVRFRKPDIPTTVEQEEVI